MRYADLLDPGSTGTVYVLGQPPGPDRAYKIGYTTRSAVRRRRELQTGQPGALKIEWKGPGTPRDEAAIHRLLGPSRLVGEWFRGSWAVRIAIGLLPFLGAHEVGQMDREQLLSFVPTVNAGMPLFHRMRPLREWGCGGYWPEWSF